jgi:hypothetical protein
MLIELPMNVKPTMKYWLSCRWMLNWLWKCWLSCEQMLNQLWDVDWFIDEC